MSKLIDFDRLVIGEFGFCLHYIQDDNGIPIEIHTHGILNNFGYLDLQIIFVPGLDVDKAKDIIYEVSYEMIELEIPYMNDSLTIIDDKELKFKMVFGEYNRTILRIIIPDENGKYPWDDECDDNYKIQFTEKEIKDNNILIDI